MSLCLQRLKKAAREYTACLALDVIEQLVLLADRRLERRRRLVARAQRRLAHAARARRERARLADERLSRRQLQCRLTRERLRPATLPRMGRSSARAELLLNSHIR
jgi:hypothetical protein